jgi:ribosomal protein S28E/S33
MFYWDEEAIANRINIVYDRTHTKGEVCVLSCRLLSFGSNIIRNLPPALAAPAL